LEGLPRAKLVDLHRGIWFRTLEKFGESNLKGQDPTGVAYLFWIPSTMDLLQSSRISFLIFLKAISTLLQETVQRGGGGTVRRT
jgi:hypothetical protein